jgi:hypothetical protein
MPICKHSKRQQVRQLGQHPVKQLRQALSPPQHDVVDADFKEVKDK